MSKWHVQYTEHNGEQFPMALWCDNRPVIAVDVFYSTGHEFPFLDMHDHEIAEVLEKLNRAEGEA